MKLETVAPFNWLQPCANALEPIYWEMHRRMMTSDYVGLDDTSLKQLDPGKGKTANVKMWAYTCVLPETPYVLYDYTRVARTGGSQKVTGLVVNGDGTPRIPRTLKREIRATLHNLEAGKPLKEGESLETIQGYLAYIYMVEPELGRKWLEKFGNVDK